MPLSELVSLQQCLSTLGSFGAEARLVRYVDDRDVDCDLELPHRGVEGWLTRKGSIDHEREHQSAGHTVHLVKHLSSGAAGVLAAEEVARSKSEKLCAKCTARPLVPNRCRSSKIGSHGILSEHKVGTTKEKCSSEAAGVDGIYKGRIHAHLDNNKRLRRIKLVTATITRHIYHNHSKGRTGEKQVELIDLLAVLGKKSLFLITRYI